MALIKCSECGQEISDSAQMCPHCGIERRKTKVEKKNINVIDILLIIVISLFSLVQLRNCYYCFQNLTLSNTLAFLYYIVCIAFLWLTFISLKKDNTVFKILSGICLGLLSILYIAEYIAYYVIDFEFELSILKYAIYSFVTSVIPLALFFLMSLKRKKTS